MNTHHGGTETRRTQREREGWATWLRETPKSQGWLSFKLRLGLKVIPCFDSHSNPHAPAPLFSVSSVSPWWVSNLHRQSQQTRAIPAILEVRTAGHQAYNLESEGPA